MIHLANQLFHTLRQSEAVLLQPEHDYQVLPKNDTQVRFF